MPNLFTDRNNMLCPVYEAYKPNETIRLAILFQSATVWASIESLYESCISDNRFEIKLIYVDETSIDKSHSVGAKEFLEQRKLPYVDYASVDWARYHPHAAVMQFPYDLSMHTPEMFSIRFRKMGVRVIYIPYGIEIADTEQARKDHFNSFVVENCWRLYTSCSGIFDEYQKYCRNRQAARICGSPKFDAVFAENRPSLSTTIAHNKKNRKLIVWKIHFPKKIMENDKAVWVTPDIDEYIAFANGLDNFKDIYFVVLAHPRMIKGMFPYDLQDDCTVVEKVSALLNILKQQDNVYIDTSADYRSSLYNADAIILDRSGIIIEAAMTKVPILFMYSTEYQEKFVSPVQKLVESFDQGASAQDMKYFVETISENHFTRVENMIKIANQNFPFQDGKCGLRIKEDIYNGITQHNEDVPRVILYAVGSIGSYYMRKYNRNPSYNFKIIGVVDSDRTKWGKNFFGFSVSSPTILQEINFDMIVIMSEPYYFEIKKYLVYDLYIDERKILRLDEFMVSVI